MNYSLVLETGIPAFIFLVIGVILTVREFKQVFKTKDKKNKK